MSDFKTRGSLSRRAFVGSCLFVATLVVLALTAWGVSTWQWWHAVVHFRQQNGFVERKYCGPPWVPESCRVLPCFYETDSIELLFHDVSPMDIQQISQIRRVRSINLSYCNLGDAGAIAISRLDNVEHLIARANNITDQGAIHLAAISKLKELQLDENPVSDASLSAFKKLTNLKWLNVSQTLVTTPAALEFESTTGIEVSSGP